MIHSKINDDFTKIKNFKTYLGKRGYIIRKKFFEKKNFR